VRNVTLLQPLTTTPWRNISLGSWRPTGDSSIYAPLSVRVEAVLAFAQQASSKLGTKVNLTHIIGAILARALREHPSSNAVIRFGRIFPRRDVDVFFHVAGRDKDDLAGFVIRQACRRGIASFAADFQRQLDDVRHGRDVDYGRSKKSLSLVPGALSKWALNISSFLAYTLNFWSPILPMPRDAFGSMMISNIGSLGGEQAFIPLAPYTRIPLAVSIGTVRDAPWVEDGEVVVAKICTLCFTFDHRLMDGVQGAALLGAVSRLCADPTSLWDDVTT
jgi:pyruvate/2-oxoglutarate dehydrogenase complex dihydrolipoamide acyltransferase (E2) component